MSTKQSSTRFSLKTYRSSNRRCYVKKVVLKTFLNFTGKHLCWSIFFIKLHAFLESFFNKVAGRQNCNFIKRLHHRCFPINIAKIWRASILKNICEQLLLKSPVSSSLNNNKRPTNYPGWLLRNSILTLGCFFGT